MEAVSAVLGAFSRQDLLRRLREPQSDTQRQFDELAMRIRAAFSPPPLAPVFTAEHLHLLARAEGRSTIATVLGWPPEDVLSNLFEAEELAETLRSASGPGEGILDPELLFFEVLTILNRVGAMYGLRDRDWGRFIIENRWLTPTAVAKLTEVAGRHGWPTNSPPTRILASVLERNTDEPEVSSGPMFDGLALVEMQRRIALLVEQLRSEASKRAEDAAEIAPDLASVAQLPAWIELYERGAVAEGLRRLFTGSSSIRDLLQGNYPDPPPVSGEPVPTASLHITNVHHFGLLGRFVSFDIACQLEGQQPPPTVILRCRGVAKRDFPGISDALRQLRGADISPLGGTLAERLLNSQVAQRTGIHGYLRLALRRFEAETIQCVVLTGLHQPIAIPAPWHEYLRTRLSFDPPPTDDVRFLQLHEVVDALRSSAAGAPIHEI
jgi:hypothetical protein